MEQKRIGANQPHVYPYIYRENTLSGNLFATRTAITDTVSRQIFEKVEQAKQQWESAVDALPELICVVDQDGSIIRANRAVEAWSQASVKAIGGQDLHELLHPGCTNKVCGLDEFLHHAGSEKETAIETYDPALQRDILVRKQPVVDQKSAARATVIIVQDISARKEMEQALAQRNQRLSVLNEIGKAILGAHSPQAIIQAALAQICRLVPGRHHFVTLHDYTLDDDQTGSFVFVNDRLAGCDQHIGEIQLDAFSAPCSIPDLAQKATLSPLEQALCRTGLRSLMRIPLVANEQFIGSLNLGADKPQVFTSDHLEIAQEVGDLIAIALQQAQLYGTLQQTNEQLKVALQAREEMIQNVSHELRTPLTLIKGYTSLLMDEDLGSLTEEQLGALGIIGNKSEQLYVMLDRLLTIQTLDQRTLLKESLHIDILLQKAVADWRIQAAEADIQLRLKTMPTLPILLADSKLFDQVITNLVHNAIKFSPAGGTIELGTWVEGQRVVIAVSDQGVGISAGQLANIFERFYQIDGSCSRSAGGMGIGLSLCQKIVHAHGGEIWAESEGAGQGSTFFVALPWSDEQNPV